MINLRLISGEPGTNRYDSESSKETVTKQKWSIGRKANALDLGIDL